MFKYLHHVKFVVRRAIARNAVSRAQCGPGFCAPVISLLRFRSYVSSGTPSGLAATRVTAQILCKLRPGPRRGMLTARVVMPVVLSESATSQEISNRIDRLRTQYAGNPLVKRIDHHIGVDWSDDPAVFIDVTLPGKDIAAAELQRLAENIRVDLLRLVRTDEIGLHSYLNFVN
jgi:hypothetical protein